MSDSSDSEVNVEISYSQRPEWSDIQPIGQDENTNEIVRIAYTETFTEVFSYFRAILKRNEKSQRAFELSKDAALLNPANYTVWYFRRLLIKELNLSLDDELEFITNIIRSHPKNYQVWQHRKNIIEILKKPNDELKFTEKIIEKDSKNYHAWQYRQWVIKKFGLWTDELKYICRLIDADIRNNSAWNQRYFYFSNKYDLTSATSIQVLNDELEYTLNKIDYLIDNESSWNYLRGLVNHLLNLNTTESNSLAYPSKVVEFCSRKINSNKDYDKSPFLVAFYCEYNMAKVKDLINDEQNDQSENQETTKKARTENIKSLITHSIELLDSLATKYDTIRVNYWNYVISKWKNQFSDYV